MLLCMISTLTEDLLKLNQNYLNISTLNDEGKEVSNIQKNNLLSQ
ncbi:MAG: hypothetical protein HeimC3_06880 [Candidatus Heimdallarchaeota archaeon LC_3]|nr:MAG: hypothetical protein HeimC3_06880 [Candidatus Heimdallarchaeota archaeon LC_3]